MVIYSRNNRNSDFDYYDRVDVSPNTPTQAKSIVDIMFWKGQNSNNIKQAVNQYMTELWTSEKELKDIISHLIRAKRHELSNCEVVKDARGRSKRTDQVQRLP